MPLDGSAGFLLSLLTESFAVRALIGSVAAAMLAMVVVRRGVVRSRGARRLTVLAPVLVAAAAAAGVAGAGGVYLPQLWITSSSPGPAGQFLDLLGELRVVAPRSGVDLLVGAYLAVVTVLLSRRMAGVRRQRRVLRSALPAPAASRAARAARRLAPMLAVPAPQVLLLADCPGGAFTVGVRKPVVVVDPVLVARLDERELEGLFAHELAHVRRWDTAVGLAVGVARDLAFFLPPVHAAQRWLRREQEESADELAGECTGRPVALASGILKAWDRHRESGGRWAVEATCGAVGRERGAAVLAARVERLIERPAHGLSGRRRRAEAGLATALVLAGAAAAWLLPTWAARQFDAYSLSFVYLSAPPAKQVEAPAFATFRALTSERSSARRLLPGPVVAPEAAPVPEHLVCPCVESPAQLARDEALTAASAAPRMLWRRVGHDPWEVAHLPERAALRSRPLLALTDDGPQVGFFVVARAPLPDES